jgi:hypothetical protein
MSYSIGGERLPKMRPPHSRSWRRSREEDAETNKLERVQT